MNYTINYAKLAQFEEFLLELNKRALADLARIGYTAPNAALDSSVMYFQPLMVAPSDRREVARWIIGSEQSGLVDSVYNRACNIFATFFFGPSEIYHLLSGEPDPEHAWVDFERAAVDPEYVKLLAENIKFGRRHGLKLWTSTELHTSLQTEARNFCRIKHNDPSRPATSTDLIEWIASWIATGRIDKILEAKTLQDAYAETTAIRGVGPYYAGNPIMMLASLPEASSDHMDAFCAPGAGALRSLSSLFGETMSFDRGVRAIAWLFERQQTLLPRLTVPPQFQNLSLHYGNLWKNDQRLYSCNSLEVGLCQFSVYEKFIAEPEAAKRRKNVPMPSFEQLRQRKLGTLAASAEALLQFDV